MEFKLDDINFSIVMAVCKKDCKLALRNCLDSIYQSIEKDDEVILVHDGPSDKDIIQFLNTYEKKNFYFFETKNTDGVTGAVNLGVEKSKNSWIARMDPDDLCVSDRFFVQRRQLKELGFPDVLSSSIVEISKFQKNDRKCRICNGKPKVPIWLRNPVYNVTTIIKKEVFLSVGGYERIPNFVDYLFWYKLFSKGYRVECVDYASVIVNLGEDISNRRGGFSYLYWELQFYLQLFRRGYLPLPYVIFAFILRAPFRLIPRWLRTVIWSFRN